jgi:hypothetical protein
MDCCEWRSGKTVPAGRVLSAAGEYCELEFPLRETVLGGVGRSAGVALGDCCPNGSRCCEIYQ